MRGEERMRGSVWRQKEREAKLTSTTQVETVLSDPLRPVINPCTMDDCSWVAGSPTVRKVWYRSKHGRVHGEEGKRVVRKVGEKRKGTHTHIHTHTQTDIPS